MATYRIDPDFVPQEPSPANIFSFREDPGVDGRRELMEEMAAVLRKAGAKQARFTITGPDDAPYPPGLWAEGWEDEGARMLPFGEAANGEGPIYPCLTASPSMEGD